jgi:hypothetical protein
MNKTTYEDYKYCIQDVSTLYIGSKYTLGELLEAENVPFKFRLVVERYILPEADLEDTLETHLYYLPEKSFHVKIYTQLKARVKVNLIQEKKGFGGKGKKAYTTKNLTVEQLAKLTVEEKERVGLVVQELILSKLALMGF